MYTENKNIIKDGITRSELIDYGMMLLKSGSLTWRFNSRDYQDRLEINHFMEWPAHSDLFNSHSSEESIFLLSSHKKAFKSPLHAAWRLICYIREVDDRQAIIEIIEASEYTAIGVEYALRLIKQNAPLWLDRFGFLLDNLTQVYNIWKEDLDTCLLFESHDTFVLWNWGTTA